jgi:hypothetical protein
MLKFQNHLDPTVYDICNWNGTLLFFSSKLLSRTRSSYCKYLSEVIKRTRGGKEVGADLVKIYVVR